ncbi:thiopeptide-type bacteriocin biosynthesis protein [Actinosynnema sp. CS-041913]|uniref:thiopeptide-type bacteriocin biosynthesis protein n=1 Tax=Actinosynnema sp. CS-041913 TaxID=3239917 RepID=UPI003D8EF3F2
MDRRRNQIYEPEGHAFGGPDGMTVAHRLFHSDSRHSLVHLRTGQAAIGERELPVLLCSTLLRGAGQDRLHRLRTQLSATHDHRHLTRQPAAGRHRTASRLGHRVRRRRRALRDLAATGSPRLRLRVAGSPASAQVCRW